MKVALWIVIALAVAAAFSGCGEQAATSTAQAAGSTQWRPLAQALGRQSSRTRSINELLGEAARFSPQIETQAGHRAAAAAFSARTVVGARRQVGKVRRAARRDVRVLTQRRQRLVVALDGLGTPVAADAMLGADAEALVASWNAFQARMIDLGAALESVYAARLSFYDAYLDMFAELERRRPSAGRLRAARARAVRRDRQTRRQFAAVTRRAADADRADTALRATVAARPVLTPLLQQVARIAPRSGLAVALNQRAQG